MRLLFAPILWLGRIFLWIVLFPIGVWRSLRHHRKKGERRTIRKVEKMLDEREREKSG